MIVTGKFGAKKRNFRKRVSDSLEQTQEGEDKGPVVLQSPAPNPARRAPLPLQTLDCSDDEEMLEPIRLKRSSHSRKMTKESLFSQRSGPTHGSPLSDTSNATGSLEIASSHLEPDPAPRDEGVVRSEELSKLRSNVQIGIIPDANAIHLAKKQREIARRRQEAVSPLPTFIPINKRTTIQDREEVQVEKPQHNSRLVREEMDVDLSEEDETLTLNHNSNKSRKATIAYNQELSSDDDEVKRWEEEQMMKGVTAGVVTDESVGSNNPQGTHYPSAESSKLRYSDNRDNLSVDSRRVFSQPSIEQLKVEDRIESHADTSIDVSVQSLLQAVRREHGELEETNSFTEMECDRNLKTMLATEESLATSKKNLDLEKENYRFFHEIGDYVHDLLECIGEKTVIIDRIESQIIGIRSEISEHILENRKQILSERDRLSRQDSLTPQSAYPSEVQLDLMTEDEKNNLTELYASYGKKRADVLQESSELFSDALEEYSSADRVIQRFETWRLNHTESYQQSYIPLFLPKILASYARMELLRWDPLSSESSSWKIHRWYVSLLPISKPENDLLSSLIEQALIPLLTQTVSSVWDPMSASQTRMLALSLLQINNEFPDLDRNAPMQNLYQAVTKRFVAATQGFYMPMFSKDHLEKNSESASLLSYQFWLGVQLGTNISLWTGLIPEHTLVELIIDGLLNRYLTLALHQFSDCLQSVEKCVKIVDFLPDCVKRGAHHSEVGALVRYMCWLVEALDRESMMGPDFIKKRARDGKVEMISLIRCLASQQASNLVQQFVNKQ